MQIANPPFHLVRNAYRQAMKKVLDEQRRRENLAESAFPAYTHGNPLAQALFWARIKRAASYVQSHGPYETSLDFGCGSGVMLPFLAEVSNSVIACDIDLAPLRAVENELGIPDGVRCVTSLDDPQLAAENGCDLIVALDVLEHVEDLDGICRQFAATLRPGGRLLVSGPSESFLYQLGRRMAGREFTGHYHVRNIYDIRLVMERYFDVSTVATLYHPLPLFRIYGGVVRKRAASARSDDRQSNEVTQASVGI